MWRHKCATVRNMRIQGNTFVVTGASGGIGGALTLALLARGARVAAIDLKAENLQKLAEQANNPETLSLHSLDITSKKAVALIPQKVGAEHKHVDALINCAGIIQPFVKVSDLDEASIERVMNVNFYGTLNMTRAFLPLLLKRPEAALVNVSSMGGFLPVPGQSVYGASKAAVKLLTEALYAELHDTNVRVLVVFPGATNTNITANSKVSMPKLTQNKRQASIPMMSAEQVAKQILRGIEKNKPQIFTGKDSKLMSVLYRINPTFATKFIAKQMRDLL